MQQKQQYCDAMENLFALTPLALCWKMEYVALLCLLFNKKSHLAR